MLKGIDRIADYNNLVGFVKVSKEKSGKGKKKEKIKEDIKVNRVAAFIDGGGRSVNRFLEREVCRCSVHKPNNDSTKMISTVRGGAEEDPGVGIEIAGP